MKRWICPHCGSSKLAPERPRKIDVRRYCLPCSEKRGVLIERSCPALDRVKGERRERAAARRSTQREKQKRREAARYVIAGVDIAAEAAAMWKLAPLVAARREHWPGRRQPKLTVRRRAEDATGHAVVSENRFHISAAEDCCPIRLRQCILHELCHLCLPSRSSHSGEFMRLLCDAAEIAFNVVVRPGEWREHPGHHCRAYSLDEVIIKRAGGRSAPPETGGRTD